MFLLTRAEKVARSPRRLDSVRTAEDPAIPAARSATAPFVALLLVALGDKRPCVGVDDIMWPTAGELGIF